jgi:hypothetical protein
MLVQVLCFPRSGTNWVLIVPDKMAGEGTLLLALHVIAIGENSCSYRVAIRRAASGTTGGRSEYVVREAFWNSRFHCNLARGVNSKLQRVLDPLLFHQSFSKNADLHQANAPRRLDLLRHVLRTFLLSLLTRYLPSLSDAVPKGGLVGPLRPAFFGAERASFPSNSVATTV